MNVSRKLKIALLTAIIGLFELPIPGVPSFVTTAEARVGRPRRGRQRRRGGTTHGTAHRGWHILTVRFVAGGSVF
jgi:hypothetical protein